VPATLASVVHSLRDIVGKGNVVYLNKWRKLQEQTKKFLRSFSGQQPFNEMSALVLTPPDSRLHFLPTVAPAVLTAVLLPPWAQPSKLRKPPC